MTGKWVRHPAQLFVTLLAFDSASHESAVEAAAQALQAYRVAVDEQGKGAP